MSNLHYTGKETVSKRAKVFTDISNVDNFLLITTGNIQ